MWESHYADGTNKMWTILYRIRTKGANKESTTESRLKIEIQNVWDETGLKVKVIEKSGISVKK